MEISRKDLEAAFAALKVSVTTQTDVFTPEGLQIHSFRYPVDNPERTAQRFWEHLAAHREREEPPPWAEEDEVAGVHVCCEHAGTDPELAAMAALLPALPLVSKLSYDTRERVMEWARRRATDGLAPF